LGISYSYPVFIIRFGRSISIFASLWNSLAIFTQLLPRAFHICIQLDIYNQSLPQQFPEILVSLHTIKPQEQGISLPHHQNLYPNYNQSNKQTNTSTCLPHAPSSPSCLWASQLLKQHAQPCHSSPPWHPWDHLVICQCRHHPSAQLPETPDSTSEATRHCNSQHTLMSTPASQEASWKSHRCPPSQAHNGGSCPFQRHPLCTAWPRSRKKTTMATTSRWPGKSEDGHANEGCHCPFVVDFWLWTRYDVLRPFLWPLWANS